MRTRSVAAALLIAFAPATFPVAAYAQAADDPTIKAARARFNEGLEFYDKGQFENARAAFLQAYALKKHPAVLENLAQSCLRSGHTLEAAKYFQQYLHESSSLTATQRADAEKGLAEARTKLGRIEVSATGGAEIFVDGEHVGTAPLTESVDVEPGPHTVKANSDTRSVAASAGQVVQVRFGIGGGAAPVVAPIPVPTPTPEEAAMNPPPETTPPPKPAPADEGPGLFSPPKNTTPVWIGAGVAVAGAGVAVLFAVFKSQANSNYTSLQNEITSTAMKRGLSPNGLCSTPPSGFATACQNLQSDQNQVNSDATAANIGIIVGAVGLAFGLGWYLFAPKRDAKDSSTKSSSFVPIFEPHQNGLGYVGSF
jgi:hypothetical protein